MKLRIWINLFFAWPIDHPGSVCRIHRCEGWKLHDTNTSSCSGWIYANISTTSARNGAAKSPNNDLSLLLFWSVTKSIFVIQQFNDWNYASSRMYEDLLLLHTISFGYICWYPRIFSRLQLLQLQETETSVLVLSRCQCRSILSSIQQPGYECWKA